MRQTCHIYRYYAYSAFRHYILRQQTEPSLRASHRWAHGKEETMAWLGSPNLLLPPHATVSVEF